jgi:hypothetical protein
VSLLVLYCCEPVAIATQPSSRHSLELYFMLGTGFELRNLRFAGELYLEKCEFVLHPTLKSSPTHASDGPSV